MHLMTILSSKVVATLYGQAQLEDFVTTDLQKMAKTG